MSAITVQGTLQQEVIVTYLNNVESKRGKFATFTVSDHNLSAAKLSDSVSKVVNKLMQENQFPFYKPDSVGAVIILRTSTKRYVLGSLRKNKALVVEKKYGQVQDILTEDGKVYPHLVNCILGGYFGNPASTVRQGIVDYIEGALFTRTFEKENAIPEEVVMEELREHLKSELGWQEEMSLRTDTWTENDKVKTLADFTAVKYIDCSDEFVEKIKSALPRYLPMVARDRDLSYPPRVQLFDLDKITEITKKYLSLTEIEKAKLAYKEHGEESVLLNCDQVTKILMETGVFSK